MKRTLQMYDHSSDYKLCELALLVTETETWPHIMLPVCKSDTAICNIINKWYPDSTCLVMKENAQINDIFEMFIS